MKDEELKELMKIDFPEIKGDENKVLSACKARNDKYNKQLIRLTYVLSSLVVIAVIVVLSVVLLSNRIYSDVAKINNSIDNLENIDNNEEKMLEIMKIEKEIQTISPDKQSKINMSKLSYETTTTVNNLKGSVEWGDRLNSEILSYSFTEITNNFEIKELYAIKGLNSAFRIQVSKKELIDLLTSYFYLPYIDVVNNKEIFYEEYALLLNGNSKDYCVFQVIFDGNTSESLFNIHVYGSGYVLLTETIKDGDSETILNMYISLIPLDYSDFKLKYGAYSVTSDFKFHEIVSFDSIESVSVTESTYWALLGAPCTFVNDDQMLEYYNSKLKNLIFTENDELVKSIQSELGSTLDNDTHSITIALKDGDIVSIFVSKKTRRFIILHGIMAYAGVGTIDYE